MKFVPSLPNSFPLVSAVVRECQLKIQALLDILYPKLCHSSDSAVNSSEKPACSEQRP